MCVLDHGQTEQDLDEILVIRNLCPEEQPRASKKQSLTLSTSPQANDWNRTNGALFTIRSNIELRTYRMILAVIFCFIFCWIPFMITYFVESILNFSLSLPVKGILFWISLANSACNPVIYGLLDVRYRSAFKRTTRPRCSR